MSKENEAIERDDLDDEVVIVEERNKTSYLYIAVAASLGLAIGGLAGSILTQNSWQQAYSSVEDRVQKLEGEKVGMEQTLLSHQKDFDSKVEVQLTTQSDKLTQEYEKTISELEKSVTELEKVNLDQENLIAKQKKSLETAEDDNQKLNRQADLQATVFERSREVFQRELTIKQAMNDLVREQDELLPQRERMKKECDVFLEGKSWDSKSDACDKSDELNSRLSQIDQMLEVHRLDLQQIQQLSEDIGL